MGDYLPSWRWAAGGAILSKRTNPKKYRRIKGTSQNLVSGSCVIHPHVAKLIPVPVPAGVR
jgi:hypothetical protein